MSQLLAQAAEWTRFGGSTTQTNTICLIICIALYGIFITRK